MQLVMVLLATFAHSGSAASVTDVTNLPGGAADLVTALLDNPANYIVSNIVYQDQASNQGSGLADLNGHYLATLGVTR